MRREAAHPLLLNASYTTSTTTAEGFHLLDLGDYPGMIRAKEGRVSGEVYEVSLTTLQELDEYEGHPDLFRREIILLAEGETVNSYLFQGETRSAKTVESGDWRDRSR